MLLLAGSVLITSLVGSPHCAAMCGGFVVFYAGHDGGRRRLAHVLYNAGRLASYVALGALAGALGAGVERAGAIVGIGRAAAWLAGTAMVLWGAASLLRALGVGVPLRRSHGGPHALIVPALRAVHAQPVEIRGLVMGLLSTLLPCGWLYAYVAIAAGTGTPLAGALVMAVFWAGTVPVMAALGMLVRPAWGGLQRRVPAIAAVVMIVLGLLTLGGRLQPHVHGDHAPVNSADAAAPIGAAHGGH